MSFVLLHKVCVVSLTVSLASYVPTYPSPPIAENAGHRGGLHGHDRLRSLRLLVVLV